MVVQNEYCPAGIRPQVVQECHARGLLCGIWEAAVDYGSPARVAGGFDFYLGQDEGAGQYDRLVSSIPEFRSRFPNMPAGIITTFGGMNTPEKARPLIDAGFTCVVEVHAHEGDGGGSGSIPSQIDYAQRVLGYPAPQAMVGLGMGARMSDYPEFDPGRGDSVFGLEELLA